MTLPDAYKWLALEPGPKMILEGLKLFGTHETPGGADNPEILKWADEVGLLYPHDSVAWCGLFMAIVARRAIKMVPKEPLWALNWRTFGDPTEEPSLGDVLVFERRNAAGRLIGGHVGLYVGHDETAFHVLGGNQADQVSIARVARDRLVTARTPIYLRRPVNVRPVRLSATGALSTNEA